MIVAYRDRHGDIWVRTRPDGYRIASSERHAKALFDSGRPGTKLATVESLYGPLSPHDD